MDDFPLRLVISKNDKVIIDSRQMGYRRSMFGGDIVAVPPAEAGGQVLLVDLLLALRQAQDRLRRDTGPMSFRRRLESVPSQLGPPAFAGVTKRLSQSPRRNC